MNPKNRSNTLSRLFFLIVAASFFCVFITFSHGQNQVSSVRMRLGEEKTLDDGMKIGLTKGDGDIFIITLTHLSIERSKTAAGSSDLGLWDFRLNVNRIVRKDGFIEKRTGVYDMVVRLRQSGHLLSGELLGSRYENTTKSCDLGTITGTIEGNKANFILEFGSKISCCPGDQWRFTGTLNANLMEGLEEPVEPPTSPTPTCISLYSAFAARRR
jgi:hypothetical protein